MDWKAIARHMMQDIDPKAPNYDRHISTSLALAICEPRYSLRDEQPDNHKFYWKHKGNGRLPNARTI